MNLKQRRIVAFAFLGLGIAVVFLAELYLTPTNFFSGPFYYLGVALFLIVGFFPYASTSRTVSRLTSTGIITGGLALVALSQKYPQALEVAFGAPAIFIGIGLRALAIRVRK